MRTDRQTRAAKLQAFGLFAKTHLRQDSNFEFLLQLRNGWTCRAVRVLPHTKSANTTVTKLQFFLQLRNGWTCRAVRVLPHTKSANTAVTKLQFFLQLRNGWTCRAVRVLPHTKVCEYSLYKTLLMMDRRGSKHVGLT